MNGPMSRRQFLRCAGRYGAVALAGSSIAGCRQNVEPRQAVMDRVQAAHKTLGGLPDNPVAVAQTNRAVRYPIVGDPANYNRASSPAYALTEEALMMLHPGDLDNPLSNIVRPGDTVVLKPNWCTQYIFPVPLTHPSVVHAVAELAARAGAATVRIVEAPMTMTQGATWFYGPCFLNVQPWLQHLAQRYPKTAFEHVDGNADAFTWVRLGERSLLTDFPLEALQHDVGQVKDDMFYHVPDSRGFDPRGYRHGLYAIANSYLDCDAFINLPKLKTHGWAGITVALKNLMGLNLISTVHRMPEERLRQFLAREDLDDVRECGIRDVPHHDGRVLDNPDIPNNVKHRENHVLWRSLADLNRIILHADRAGVVQPERQRRYLNVVDGIIGIDGDGPIIDSRVHARTIVAGADPVRLDAVCCRIMGYGPHKIPLVDRTGELTGEHAVGDLEGYEESVACSRAPGQFPRTYRFRPPGTFGTTPDYNIWYRGAS